jgi:Beta-galactosidase
MRHRLALAALLGALGLTLAATPASAAVPRDFWGVIPINELTVEDFDRMGQGEVGTLRIAVLWRTTEPSQGQFDFDYLDFVVGQAASRGVKVLPFAYGSPDWVEKDCTGLTESQCERVPPATASARTAWSDFLKALAGRYGPGGTFWQQNPGIPALPIRDWQIWNEPSSPTYWQPEPSANAYAQLVKLSHEAITSVDSGARVVLAGLFGTPQGDLGSKNVMWKYLGRVYRSHGIKRAFDAVAIHPYSPNLEGIEFQLDKAKRKIDKNHDSKTEILVTEIGWGSDPPPGDKPLIKGPDGQRKLLEKSFRMLRRARGKYNLGGVVWYAWQDPGVTVETCSFCSSAGLFEEDGTAKPSWTSFVKFTGGTP